ncbi:MAG TPA: GH92 family glycosyl hydrolase [Terriglobales bacterium]|jgi:predicted alpha-1,2-mannosidase|nr:GH92 family glycosyl hydrolase [Terriglobales bacterium]
MRRFLLLLLLTFASVWAQTSPTAPAYDSVNPFIGTAGDGNTFPGATLPLGMMQWSPDTRSDGWYHYQDTTARGFSLTHISGAGCTVYADVPILPWITELGAASPNDLVVPFSHDHEQAHPGYYSVTLDNGVKTELTVAARAGIGRFVFPAGAQRILLFKAGSSGMSNNGKRAADTSTVKITGNETVTGTVRSGGFCESETNYVLHFVAKFAQPFSAYGTWNGNAPGTPGARAVSGHKAGAYVSFPKGSGPVLMKIGISFVSVENAAKNLVSEIPGWDFDVVHAAARKSWTQMLDRVQTSGGTPDQRTIFYTGLYHMLLSPNIFSDGNGDYIGFDNKVRRLPAGKAQYANFSDWDIYRSLIQFQALLLPAQTSQMMQSLVRDAEQSGWLPRWPVANDVSYVMGGDSSSILLSNGYAFGARSFDTASALRFMIKGATQPGTGPHGNSERPQLSDYLSKGYVPVSDNQEAGASITLEYASADFAVSQFAASLGDKAHAASLLRSAQNWHKLFDSESGFIRPRTVDGNFISGWDPDQSMPRHRKMWDKFDQMGFEEGNTWQYTWMIPHNYAGLFKAMGGNQNVIPKLDKFFVEINGWGKPNFTVANEPDFCAPYAYVWTGSPWKTQEVVDRIRRETFTTKPDGLPGNDDLGATSGVYVWNALGMYPVIQGVGGLVLGTPMFPHAVLKFGDGRVLEIASSGKGIYVQSVELNGKPHQSAWLPINKLRSGQNRVEFKLGREPNRSWGSQPENLPPSFDVPEK